MKVDQVDTVDDVVYVLTETHKYSDVLNRVREIEPAVNPIKHVNADLSTLATGYTIPSQTPALDTILTILKETAAS